MIYDFVVGGIIAIIIFIIFRDTNSLIKRKKDAKITVAPKKDPISIQCETTVSVNDKDEKNFKKWIKLEQELIINNYSVLELIKTTPIDSIVYGKLLECFEWKYKRFKILVRDKFTCADCNEKKDHLQVHHKYYLKGFLPWEIEDTELIALCRNCHKKRHENENIAVYQKVNNQLILSEHSFFYYCYRCQGTGYLPQYKHVKDGICFLCWGKSKNHSIFYDRIIKIKNDPNSYDLNERFDECFNFFDSITLDFYRKHVQDKSADELNDFFEYCSSSHKSISNEKSDFVNEDDLPF